MTEPATEAVGTPVPTSPAAPGVDLDGPLERTLLRLAVPLLVGYLAQLGFNWVNTVFMDWLGPEAQAAVGATMFVQWFMMAYGELASVGTMALVARAVGAKDPRAAGAAAVAGATLSLGLGLLLSLASPVVAPLVVATMGLEPVPAALCTDYLRVLFLGAPTLSVFYLLEAVCRGAGETRRPMAVLAVSFVLNGLLDWLLIFGAGPVPALGVQGAAWATVAARGVGCAALLGVVLNRAGRLGLAWPGWRTDPKTALAVLRIGVPASAAGLGFSAIYFLLVAITARFGTAAVAALAIGLRLEGIAYITCAALGRAAATLAGQALGARRPDRARAVVRAALRLGCLAMVPLTVLMLFTPHLVVRWFATDPAVAEAAASYLRIAGLVLLAMCLEVIYENVAAGVGDTVPAMTIEVLGTLLRVPFALGLAHLGIGSDAVWWSVAATVVIKAAAFDVWFRADRWATRAQV